MFLVMCLSGLQFLAGQQDCLATCTKRFVLMLTTDDTPTRGSPTLLVLKIRRFIPLGSLVILVRKVGFPGLPDSCKRKNFISEKLQLRTSLRGTYSSVLSHFKVAQAGLEVAV